MVVEPIFKEPGNIGFQWLEIHRTKASLIQQLDIHTNYSLNDTLSEFGFIPKEAECEHKCPELDACIDGSLWCDGKSNFIMTLYQCLVFFTVIISHIIIFGFLYNV